MKLREHLPYKEHLVAPVYDLNLVDLSDRLDKWTEWGLEFVPAYHRGDVWNGKKQELFMEYFLFGGGFTLILNIDKRTKCPTHLIDGLQRLTAIRNFLNNGIRAFGYFLEEYEDRSFYLRETYVKVKNVCLKNDRDIALAYAGLNTGRTC